MLPRFSLPRYRVAGIDRRARVLDSESNFPIAAGLASSASSFAATRRRRGSGCGEELRRRNWPTWRAVRPARRRVRCYGGFVELENAAMPTSRSARCARPKLAAEGRRRHHGVRAEARGLDRGDGDQPQDVAVLCKLGRRAGCRSRPRRARRDRERDFERSHDVAEHNCLKMHSSCGRRARRWSTGTRRRWSACRNREFAAGARVAPCSSRSTPGRRSKRSAPERCRRRT